MALRCVFWSAAVETLRIGPGYSEILDAFRSSRGVTIILSGCAPGADTLGIEWAEAKGIQVARFPADWNTHGRAAGPIRNQQMLDEGKPELVVSFLGGRRTGGYGQAREDGRN